MSKQQFINQYFDNKKSIPQISKENNCDINYLRRIVKTNSIKLRTAQQSRDNNLFGRKYGKLTVISRGQDRKHVVCKCDCGIVKQLSLSNLQCSSGIRTKSCGCHLKSCIGSNSWRWKGYKDIGRTYYTSLVAGAKIRNIIFDQNVTIEYIWELYLKQNRMCALSGIKIQFNQRGLSTASVDRIDSNLGYSRQNIQIVHKDINIMKMDMNQKAFISMCQAVYRHNSSSGKDDDTSVFPAKK